MLSNWKTELDNMRDRRRRLIVDAAERVFLNSDLARTTMADIAREAGTSRVTLYKYFATIDELAFEVQMRALDVMLGPSRYAVVGEGSALEKIERFFSTALNSFDENRQHIRFSGLFDHYYQSTYPNLELEKRYADFLSRFNLLEKILLQGIIEGSIRKDLDVHNTSVLLGNLFIGLMQRMAIRGDILSKEQNIDPKKQLDELIKMISTYISVQKE
jgi:AcrR family transcriptional regulator